eukprot:5029488-Pleurochrysis_carterae.AAC.1
MEAGRIKIWIFVEFLGGTVAKVAPSCNKSHAGGHHEQPRDTDSLALQVSNRSIHVDCSRGLRDAPQQNGATMLFSGDSTTHRRCTAQEQALVDGHFSSHALKFAQICGNSQIY